jgi:hypothetical protein
MSTSNSGPLFNEGELNPAPATMSSERRRVARASVMIPVRLRPVRFTDGNFEDVTSTVNVARGCLYVTTWRDSYYPGMRVLVTYPYISSGKSSGWEYLAEVVRLETHPDGRYRVAVKLQFVMQSAPSPRLLTL